MKACKFCNTQVDNNATHCPSCGSAVFLNVCENCGTLFDSGFCPNCGIKAGQKKKTCPDCGSIYFTNACPNCGYTPARKPAVQKVEQTVIHKHIYEERPVRTSPTPTQARRATKKGKGCGCGTIILVFILIAALFGNRGGTKKNTTTTRTTSTTKVSTTSSTKTSATKAPTVTATPEPAITAAQESVDKYFESASEEEIAAVRSADSILYQSTARKNGKVIEVRRSYQLDRGTVGTSKYEPDYVASLGYAAVYEDQKLENNSAFGTTPWKIPVYQKDKQFWQETGTIDHKTEVVVIGQDLTMPKSTYKTAHCTGYLHVIRMDTRESCWLNVTNYVNSPYWDKSLTSAQEKGYCIATFKQVSDYYPVTKGKEKAEIDDGTLVLLPMKAKASGSSPDKANNPIPGIVFKQWRVSYGGVTVWFNEKDLSLTY